MENTVLKRLSADECTSAADRDSLAQCAQRYVDVDIGSPHHIMLWGKGVDDGGTGCDADVWGVVSRLVQKTVPGLDVLSVRLLVSPPGSPAQPWHIDYAQDFRTVWTILLGLTPSTELNCTELLRFGTPGDGVELELLERARKQAAPLRRDDWSSQPHSIVPLVLEQWEAVVLQTSHCFHRRGPNRTSEFRITLNVDCAPAASAAEWICVDTQRSLNAGRVCPREQVDDLGEQDCYLDE
eukprot:TRINITY_DN958_c3_g2_i1.p1 TRINITY_DN958_c3_g2~~TRINITY_DN958_c3_g2_i1.p1  ORF type:complete len:239 (+),score=10.57 TRINITY_DN958_c3_g2_i1:415-1131(+)